jgi:hypothetical protein
MWGESGGGCGLHGWCGVCAGGYGVATGTLNVASPAIANQANVTLSGTGALAAAVHMTPATINFPVTGAGQTSSATTVTVTNTGVADALTDLMLTAPAGFVLVNNACMASLAPGVSCTVGVEFAPTAAGEQTGDLTVSSSALPAAATAALNGMGFDFTVTFLGSSMQSVASGQTALYTLVLTPLSGSAGAFSFACGSLPADAICTFNPTAEMLSSGVTGNVTVQVSTGSATSTSRLIGPGAWSVVPVLCGLVLLPLGWKRRGEFLHGMLPLMVLGILAAGALSCAKSGGGTGGGSGSDGGAGSTPAGTYSVTVTVTSTGVSHSVPLTLTVD